MRSVNELRAVVNNLLMRVCAGAGMVWSGAGLHRLEPKHPIFIVGCARSGTTLLAGAFNSHPRVADWSEANELWDPSWYSRSASVKDRPPVEFDPRRFIDDWWSQNERRMPTIGAAFAFYQRARCRDWFLNKSADHTFRVSYLRQWFPEAHFIHIIRDGRAVALSYAKKLVTQDKLQRWPAHARGKYKADFAELVLHLAKFWRKSVEAINNQSPELRANSRYVELRYEDVCENPRLAISQVAAQIGLTPTSWAGLDSLQARSRNFKWRDDMNPETIRRIEDAIAPMLIEYGYLLTTNL